MDINGKTNEASATTTGTAMHGISARALRVLGDEPDFLQYFAKTSANKYHPDENPEGIIPFGLAENKLGIELVRPKLEEIAKAPDDSRVYSYSKWMGDDDFRGSIKRFLQHNFHPNHELDVKSLFGTDGVTVVLENLAFVLAQPGEYIMVLCPFYYRLAVDFMERPDVKTLPVQQTLKADESKPRYALDVSALEDTLQQAKSQGKVVRAIHVTNPNNPTGDVYTAQELKDLLDFAHRHHLHVIANELYGLSVFDPDVTFTSILSLPHPDPDKVHFTWGISKDFGLSGYRIGCMYTRNVGVANYFRRTAIYIRPPNIAQFRIMQFLDDLDFIDKTFKPEMRKRILARHQGVQSAVEGCGGRVHASPATIFRWLDLSMFLPSQDWAGEHELFLRLYSGGVHLLSGQCLGHSMPGWFRMVASMEEGVHAEGMKRIVAVLTATRAEQQQKQDQKE